MPKRILLTDDDETMRLLVVQYLVDAGYETAEAGSAAELQPLLRADSFDLLLLDLTLPDEDGLVILRKLRATSRKPVIVVSARKDDENRLAALELGADDFVVKPFNPRELVLRIQRVLERVSAAAPIAESGRIEAAGWTLLGAERRLLGPDGAEPRLTRTEFDLLRALMEARGKVVSRGRLADIIAAGSGESHPNSLNVLISRLRAKLGDSGMIVTVPNVGYRIQG